MGTDSRSHTHRCTGTKFWCDRRAHTHGDTCRYTSAPGKTSGVARGAGEGVPGTHGHTQGPAHTTRACAHHNPAPSPRDQFRRPRAAPAKRGGFESVSPQFLALPGPRGPPEAPRPAVARTCRPHEARQQPPQSGPSAGPTRCVHARRESCGPFGAPKNYNSQKAPRCAHTATEAPPPAAVPASPKLQLPEGPASARCGKKTLSLSKSPRRAGRANGGGTPRPQGGGGVRRASKD